jgi:large subunit ribosomal protein L30e
MAIEASTEIRRAVDTGKVVFGQKQCQKELLKGNGEIIVFSNNIPSIEKEKLEYLAKLKNKKIFEFSKNGLNLGSICGKPFVISTLLVLDKGKSKVLELDEKVIENNQ